MTKLPLAGLRVLAVEDEALLALMLSDMLSDLGIEVLGPVRSVAQALSIIEKEGTAIDAAVLDIQLGSETAYPIADALAARGTRFVFLSGYGADGVVDRHRLAPVLSKPADASALARMIALVVRKRPRRVS